MLGKSTVSIGHVGFVKIRHYGILASKNKTACILTIREQLGGKPGPKPIKGLNWIESYILVYGQHPKLCPCCKKGIMVSILEIIPAHKIRQRDGPALEANTDFYRNRE